MTISLLHVQRRLQRQDFCAFLRGSFGLINPGTAYLHNWHIEQIAQALEACRQRDIRRLIINMPPRALKSICINVAWPAFLLGHDPATRIIAASYAQGLSVKHAQDSRLIMQSGWYGGLFPRTRPRRGENEKHKLVTTRRGFRLATSVGGTLTGEGGDFLIVDDPMNAANAYSHTARERVKHWFDYAFTSRLNDKKRGVIVVVMQRLHEDDLTGHLLKKGGWEHLCLPAINAQGEALHAAREDVPSLQRLRREMGEAAFAAQYLQQPLREEGAFLKREWFRRFDLPQWLQRAEAE